MTLQTIPGVPAIDTGEPNFSVRHQDWIALANRWRMAWAIYRGGVHVLDPDIATYRARWPVNRRQISLAGQADAEPSREQSNFEWEAGYARSFLWKHDRETPEEFADRHRRLYHFPLFRSDINNYVAGVLKQAPTRREVGEGWKAWHRNVDGIGTNIDAMIRRTLARSLVFGRMHAIVDRLPAEGIFTKQQADAEPPPYCYLVSPLDLVDWQIGSDNQFNWVVVRRDDFETRQPGKPVRRPLDRYTVIDRETFRVYVEQEDTSVTFSNSVSFKEVGEPVVHGLGRVPIATLWATEEDADRVMACESPFADALDFNRHQLNKLSELDEVERMQTFSILAWPTAEGAPLGELEIGPNRAASFDSTVGDPHYISPDVALGDGKWKRIETQTQLSRTLEGTSRGRAEYSKEERSAASITVESEDKRNRMSWWASAVQEFDEQLHDIVGQYLGESEAPETAYVKDFDFRATSAQVADIVQLKVAGLPKKAIFALAKGPTEKILRENGVPPDQIDEVTAAIDEEADKPDPEPMVEASPLAGKPSQDNASTRDRGSL